MMSDTDVQLLINLGLGETEARVYLALGAEKETVMGLAKRIKIARTSIYMALDKLLERGLVERVVEYKKSLYKRASGEMLDVLVNEEKKRWEKMELSKEIIKSRLKTGLKNAKTEVRYYHGQSGFQQMMWNVLSAKEETVGWSEFGRVEVVGNKFIENWAKEFKTKGLRDRVICNSSKKVVERLGQQLDEAVSQLETGDVRLVDEKEMYISGDTTIYNNVFAVCWWGGGEVVGVEIENEELVKTQKTVFETMWKKAKEFKKNR